jgi:protein TonB
MTLSDFSKFSKKGILDAKAVWFPLLIFISISLHGALIALARWEQPARVSGEIAPPPVLEVDIVQELPVLPEPADAESTPVVEAMESPQPLPEPILQEAEVLQQPSPLPEPEKVTSPAPVSASTKSALTKVEKIAKPFVAKPARTERASSTPALIKAVPETYRNPAPRYPDIARRNKWQGRAMVRAEVDERGRVESVLLVSSTGYSVLDQAAVSAVRTWRFRPGSLNGAPIRSTVEVPVNFRLE